MARAFIVAALVALVAAAAPASATEQRQGSYYPYDVYAKGTLKESWRIDRDDVPDACDRFTTGSGSATWSWSMPKPKRLWVGAYSGFRTKPVVKVRVDRRADVQTTPSPFGAECEEPAPAATGCGARTFNTRLQVDSGRPFAMVLDRGDAELFE